MQIANVADVPLLKLPGIGGAMGVISKVHVPRLIETNQASSKFGWSEDQRGGVCIVSGGNCHPRRYTLYWGDQVVAEVAVDVDANVVPMARADIVVKGRPCVARFIDPAALDAEALDGSSFVAGIQHDSVVVGVFTLEDEAEGS